MFPVSGVSLFGSCVTCVCTWSADRWHHGMGEKRSLLILLHKRVGHNSYDDFQEREEI